MNRAGIALLCLPILGLPIPAAAAPANELEKARREAERTGKPMMVAFRCVP
jgi:hypothetical protein